MSVHSFATTGTLTLGLRGETRFFGQTSRSEAPERLSASDVILPRLSSAMADEANKELDVPLRNAEIATELMKLLPPLSQACQLCETFIEFGKFAWYPLPRRFIFDDIISVIYHTPHNGEKCNYYLLSRIALRFAPPAHDTTLTAIQTMIYMTQYLEMSDCEPAHTGSHKAWMQIGQAVKLGHSVYVSSSRWRLGKDAALKRNQVFWQLFMQDTWLSFGFGRPPSINLDFVDCEVPKEPDVVVTDQDQREAGFHVWTWQYTKLLYSIMTSAFGAKAPNYAKVMELDRKVRDFPVPAALRIQCGQVENPPPTTALHAQRALATLLKETTLLNLHRPYFSQALNDMPEDPLRHRYGPSVMAIYRSAWRIFASARCSFKTIPSIASRVGIIWSHSLSGAIVMCLLVTRAPSSNLAKCSMNELEKLCDLFEEAASMSQIASNNLDVMRKLRKQAHDAMNKAHAAEEAALIHSELDRLGGKTHLICPTEERPMPCGKYDHAARAAAELAACEATVQPDMIHPTIMQDLRAFDGVPIDVDDASGRVPHFNLDFPSTAFPNPQQAEFPLFPDFDFASPAGASTSSGTPSSGAAPTPAAMTADPWAHPMQAALDPPPGVPVLDATWQAFVEQLGF
ncbi:hypothetical protein BD413DRAFT_512633 [Trametes elegans]|nr:hypothetical protein BD413DRAFT_512633 [Trametes elegans]